MSFHYWTNTKEPAPWNNKFWDLENEECWPGMLILRKELLRIGYTMECTRGMTKEEMVKELITVCGRFIPRNDAGYI